MGDYIVLPCDSCPFWLNDVMLSPTEQTELCSMHDAPTNLANVHKKNALFIFQELLCTLQSIPEDKRSEIQIAKITSYEAKIAELKAFLFEVESSSLIIEES